LTDGTPRAYNKSAVRSPAFIAAAKSPANLTYRSGDIIDSVTPQPESKVDAVRTLMVYIEGNNGRWEAICLNFDIAVQGTSLDGVIASMKEAVSMYLACAVWLLCPCLYGERSHTGA
jgi:hypothetical protein